MHYGNILELIGNTPLVRLNRVTDGVGATVLAKLEFMNPGGSVKDRIGIRLIESAEQKGLLKPGGTIIEPTSGNTGMGLALAATIKGYRCIFVMPDKVSDEKIRLLESFGCEVVMTPTGVATESPESYNSVANRLSREIPGAYMPNQFVNQANPEAHYATTGPEIWNQTNGKVTAFVAGAGTGGTISGAGRYLKEQNASVLVVGADPEGSVYSGDTPKPYKVEGIGEDFIPETLDLSVIDRFERVGDREAFQMARRLTREEGLFVGGSSGTAVVAALRVARDLTPDDVVVVILPDGGRSYISKLYSDPWMRQYGFMDNTPSSIRIGELLGKRRPDLPKLLSVSPQTPAKEAITLMNKFDISQLPVIENGIAVGSLQEASLLNRLFQSPERLDRPVADLMGEPFPAIDVHMAIESAYQKLTDGPPAVLISEAGRAVGIVTKIDLIEYLAERRNG